MEDSKLQALHDSLSQIQRGKGLGVRNTYSWQRNAKSLSSPSSSKSSSSLPNNPLYAYFVPEGTYDPNAKENDGDGRFIKRDFSDDDEEESDSDDDDSDKKIKETKNKKEARRKAKEERKAAKKAAAKAAKLEAKKKAKLEEKKRLKKDLKRKMQEQDKSSLSEAMSSKSLEHTKKNKKGEKNDFSTHLSSDREVAEKKKKRKR